MGFLQRIGLLPQVTTTPTQHELLAPLLDTYIGVVTEMPTEELFAEQPHLRTVTTFIARAISSTSLHVYRRDSDGGRHRVRDSDLAKLMRRSSKTELMQDMLNGSILDLCLYDEFIWVAMEDSDSGEWELHRIPPTWIKQRKHSDPWTLEWMGIIDAKTGQQIRIPAERIIHVHGYNPTSTSRGLTPVVALRETLKEQLESAAYRGQLWRNGPRLGGVITRPKDAKWDSTSRKRFKAAWQSQYSGRGSGAGGTPILEDGMQFVPAHLKAQDEQVVEMTKLSLQTVASIYHVNPVMVGLLDNANYSNVREFRRSLYGDSLGPIIKQVEGVINEFLRPMIDDDDAVYVEFNLDEKLRASFEEKAEVTSTAVGGPWMTRNEARAMNNLPAIDGGEDLITPLNVTKENSESNNDVGLEEEA
ncbi:phage portal protein [Corynebacterium diphtheriae]